MSDYTPDDLEKVREAERKVSTRSEVQDNFNMVMEPYGNIEDLICPAPLSIALLGQLILLSLETDFSLEVKNAAHPPELLNYPGSLRASLLQVSHAGWDAFNLAHKNMDQIRLQTANVPTHINNSVKIIVSGTKREMEVVLPKALKNIKRIATDCTKRAKDVEDEFMKVISLTSELLQLCTARRGEHEQEMKENEFARQAAEDARKRAETEQEDAEKEREEMRKHFKQTREDYKKALDEVPSGMSLLAMSILDKASSAVIETVQMYTNPMRKVSAIARTVTGAGQSLKETFFSGKGQQPAAATSMPQFQQQQITDLRKLSSTLLQLRDILECLQGYFNTQKDRKAGVQEKGNIEYTKAQANQLQDTMKTQMDSQISTLVTSRLQKTIRLIEEVSEQDTMITKDPERLEAMKKDAREMGIDVDSLLLQVNVQEGNLPTLSTPKMSAEQVDSNTSKDVIQAAVAQSRMKFEQTSLIMRQAMDQYKVANERNQAANKAMAKLVSDIAMYDMKKIDFETIRKTLLEGIDVLGKVREQWSKLIQYFQMMANIIEVTLTESLTGFLEDMESGRELRSDENCQTLSDVMRDSIYVSASKANQIAYLVHGLSSTYIEVSAQHIMPPLGKLDTYMALDAAKDHGKIKSIQKQIEADSKKASTAISELVRERHDEILDKGYERIANYERTMKAALPPPTRDEEAKLQKMKKAAVKPLSQPAVGLDGW